MGELRCISGENIGLYNYIDNNYIDNNDLKIVYKEDQITKDISKIKRNQKRQMWINSQRRKK